jgi:hypothetical protein
MINLCQNKTQERSSSKGVRVGISLKWLVTKPLIIRKIIPSNFDLNALFGNRN